MSAINSDKRYDFSCKGAAYCGALQHFVDKLHGFGTPKLNNLKTTPTPNKNGSYGIKGEGFVCHILGCVCHIFGRNPLILTDFYAMWTPIVWHNLGGIFLANMGAGVVRIVFINIAHPWLFYLLP